MSSSNPPKNSRPGAPVPRGAGKRLTINDIAKLAGVSKKQVSRVINNESGASQETKERVREIMRREGYAPSRKARALVADKSYLIALAYNNPNPHYVIELLEGMQREAGARGFEVVMHAVPAGEQDLHTNIATFMRRSGCDGVILSPPLSEVPELIGAFREEPWKLARIAGDDVDLDLPQVRYDDRAAALAVTNHLLDLGHTSVAFVGGPRQSGPTRRRLAGFHDAMALKGLMQPENFFVWGDFTFASGVAAGRQLVSFDEPPTGVMCCNDQMASGVLHAFREAGRRAPVDISVTGFDDSPLAEQIWPPLTTVRQPVVEMARKATSMLIGEVSGEGASSERAEYAHVLVCRQSTGGKRKS